MSFLTSLFKKKPTTLKGILKGDSRQWIGEEWKRIEKLVKIEKPSTLREAVVEADKLVDFTLDKIYPGSETTGQRLKLAKELFGHLRQDYENLWYAHKIRNEMVHSVGFELPVSEAKNVLAYFKRALEILGALPTSSL